MVGFDVSDNRHHRLQMQERRIALIRFSNQITAMAQTRVNARRFYQATVNEGRIKTGFCINTGDHRRGRRFTVGTRNGNTVTKTHQLSQHLCAANHRNTRFVRGNNLRVIRGDRA
ncbi:hypothetical protein D3C72_994270 [compost metagenome]